MIEINNKKILMTGGSGFVGTHLLRSLVDHDCDVGCFHRGNIKKKLDITQFIGDIRDRVSLKRAVRQFQPHIVFHLAGSRVRALSEEAFDEATVINLIGTLNLLWACQECSDLQSVVMIGTGEEYGGCTSPYHESFREAPVSAYSFSKVSATHLAQLFHRNFGMPIVVLRPSVAYGPGQKPDMFLPSLIESLRLGQRFAMTGGEQTRDFIFIKDAVDASLMAATSTCCEGQVINIGSGTATRISTLVEQVESMMGVTGLVDKGAIPYRSGEPMNYVLDITKARETLGWTPMTALDDGLRTTIEWHLGKHA